MEIEFSEKELEAISDALSCRKAIIKDKCLKHLRDNNSIPYCFEFYFYIESALTRVQRAQHKR